MISFHEDKCQGCGLCVEACPRKILTIDKSKVNKRGHTPVAVIDEKKCISCAFCAVMCPDVVIEIS
jgi:2-oxoglutarate ferredoxin oxidoreductase subunit delta